jgi:hypothetical protein
LTPEHIAHQRLLAGFLFLNPLSLPVEDVAAGLAAALLGDAVREADGGTFCFFFFLLLAEDVLEEELEEADAGLAAVLLTEDVLEELEEADAELAAVLLTEDVLVEELEGVAAELAAMLLTEDVLEEELDKLTTLPSFPSVKS